VRSPRVLAIAGIALILTVSLFAMPSNKASGLSIADPYGGFPCNGWCAFDVKTEEWTYSVIYGLSGEPYGRGGVQVDNIAFNYPNKSLEIDVIMNQSGTLTIVLQRHLINAEQLGREIQYVVRIDGREIGHGSNKDDLQSGKAVESDVELFSGEPYDARMLQIPFTKDSKHIEVVGTWMRNVNGVSETSFPCTRLQDNCTVQLRDSKAIGNRTFDIRYAVQGSADSIKVNDIYIDWAQKALIVETTANQSGRLTLVLPEQVIQSWDYQIAPHDEQAKLSSHQDFSIRRNFGEGYNVEHYNLIGQEERLLNISLPKGTFDLEILGTGIIGGDKIPDELPPEGCEGTACTYQLEVDNRTIPISYYMNAFRYIPDSEDPKVTAMRLDSDALVINIEAEQRGMGGIMLYIPYEIIDSSFPNSISKPFEVYVDGIKGSEYKSRSDGIEGNIKDPVYYQDANTFPPSPNGERLRIVEVSFNSGARQIELRQPAAVEQQPTPQPLHDSYWITTFPFEYLVGAGAIIAGIAAFFVFRKRR
jgi:hypothetical protein